MLRAFLRGVFALFVVVCAFGIYHLYRSGRLPFVQRAIHDAAVIGSVEAAFAIHKDLGHRALDVSVEDGTVVLTGRVASDDERVSAEEIASSIEGVSDIDNRIEVDPDLPEPSVETRSLGTKLDDVTLLAKVRAALHLDRETRKLDIDVTASSGKVELRGSVPTRALAVRIRERVEQIEGVEEIDDGLEILPSPRAQE
jgi:hyperosmotically inducible protein